MTWRKEYDGPSLPIITSEHEIIALIKGENAESYADLIVRAVNRNDLFEEMEETLESIAGFAVGHGDVCETIAARARAILAKIEKASS